MSRLALRPGDCLELETQDFAGTGYRRRITITGLTPKGTGSTSIAYEAEEDKGDHKEKVIVKAAAFSETAKEKIEQAGGKAEVI